MKPPTSKASSGKKTPVTPGSTTGAASPAPAKSNAAPASAVKRTVDTRSTFTAVSNAFGMGSSDNKEIKAEVSSDPPVFSSYLTVLFIFLGFIRNSNSSKIWYFRFNLFISFYYTFICCCTL
jgi:hypothetical protein